MRGRWLITRLGCGGSSALARFTGPRVARVAKINATTKPTLAHSGGTMEYATAPTATTNTHVYSSNTTLRCECPNVRSRWCRCFLSALNGDCPLRTRRTTAITRSNSGTATAASTTIMGDNNATMSTAP